MNANTGVGGLTWPARVRKRGEHGKEEGLFVNAGPQNLRKMKVSGGLVKFGWATRRASFRGASFRFGAIPLGSSSEEAGQVLKLVSSHHTPKSNKKSSPKDW